MEKVYSWRKSATVGPSSQDDVHFPIFIAECMRPRPVLGGDIDSQKSSPFLPCLHLLTF